MQFSVYNAENILLCNDFSAITCDILQQSKGSLYIKTQIPIVDVISVWTPSMPSLPPARLPWKAEFSCGANTSYPMFVFLDSRYNAAYAVGLTNVIDDCQCSAKMNQALCSYEIVFHIAVTAETEPFEIFFDDSHLPIADVLQLYRNKIMPQLPAYPAGAWESVYCTWYAVHAAVTCEYLRNNAAEAARLGFGTFIVDDGWCFSESKRVTPETLPDWYRDIGDWQLSEQKLPEMKKIVAEAQKLGLNYMFWVAPFFAGRRSGLAGSVKKYLTGLHEGQRVIDPEDKAAMEEVTADLLKILAGMQLDGLKIDFLDSVLPDVNAPRSRSVRKYVENLVKQIRKYKPDALIEFRQNYATPANAALATAFRAGDVPFDYIYNFNRCLQIRLHMGDNIPIHSDPVYFNRSESVEAVGRHMIASLAGVPMLSMELRDIDNKHKKVIANYIAFYKKHQSVLNHGKWSFEFRQGVAVYAKATLDDESVIILTDELFAGKALQECCGKVTILNMSGANIPLNGKIFDAQGNELPDNQLPSGGRADLNR